MNNFRSVLAPASVRYIYTLPLQPDIPTHSYFSQIYLHAPTSARYTYTLSLQPDIPTHSHFSQIYLHTITSARYTYTLPLQPDIPTHSNHDRCTLCFHFSQPCNLKLLFTVFLYLLLLSPFLYTFTSRSNVIHSITYSYR